MILLKTSEEIQIMDEANRIVHEVLQLLGEAIVPGVNLLELEKIAANHTRKQGGEPAFLGYHGYPACSCISLNEEVVHGIPRDRKVAAGDLVSVDYGVQYRGFVGDAARTFVAGETDPESRKLVQVTQNSLEAGQQAMVPGNRVGDIGHRVQEVVEASGFAVVEAYVGHGIGRKMHEAPQVPNYGPGGLGPRLKAGMVLAVEPMVNVGGHEVEVLEDGWTVVTKDRKRSAHFENSIAITNEGPKVLGLGAA